ERSPFLTASSSPPSHPLSLHDALPISDTGIDRALPGPVAARGDSLADLLTRDRISRQRRNAVRKFTSANAITQPVPTAASVNQADRKSTRLNSSHVKSSYAVFCLKKKR